MGKKLRTEFEAKANIFNKYFVSQCTTINNNSVLSLPLYHLTDDKLSSFNISSKVIFQLIKNLDPNKAHGHDERAFSWCFEMFLMCLYCQFVKNYWKNLRSTQFWILLILEMCFQFTKQDFVQVTPVCFSSFRLFTIFTMPLTSILAQKWEVFSLISPKH